MKNVIIIGGGPAGLTAAYYFLKQNTGIHPILIEEEAFVGGIARTAEYKGNRMDIGGHRFFTKNEEIMALWKSLLPVQGSLSYDDKKLGRSFELAPNGPDPEKEDDTFLIRHRVSRILYLHHFFDYPISLSLGTIKNLGLLRMMKIGIGYLSAMAHQIPETTLADFMVNRFGKPLYNMFFKDYTHKVWGRWPEEIGADWGAQRIKGLSLKKALLDFARKTFGTKDSANTETSLIEQFYYPKYGPGQLWEKLRQEITKMGGEILMETRAVKINRDKGNHVISVETEDKKGRHTITCDDLISSMPINDLVAALGETDSPAGKAAHELPYRDFTTVGVLVDKLKIKNETNIKTLGNIVPDCWIYVQEPEVSMGRIQIFNNWSPYLIADPDNTVWIGLEYFCTEGDEMWTAPDDEFIKKAIDELITIDVIESKAAVKDAVRLRVKKAYPAYFGSYKDFDKIRAFLDTIPNLWCIGRNGQHRYNNMDHSMLTAIEAVKAIAFGSKTKADVWNVNTETEYHEEK